MKVAITGSSGLVGTALRRSLSEDGHEVLRLVRRPPDAANEVQWDPPAGELDPAALEGVDAVVNLAGVGFGDQRWTDSYKQAILDSRLNTTDLVSRRAAEAGVKVMVSGSAIGYYGSRGSEVLTEESTPGDDYAAQVCVQWEAATAPAEQAGVRVAHIRSGLVMSSSASLVKRLVLPFKLGIGGRLGSGKQYWSWIDILDHIAAVRFLIDGDQLAGPYNLTAPNPVQFDEVKDILGEILHRPTFMPVPTIALKTLFGPERTEAILLAGQRVLPKRLQEAGFDFRFSTLEASLRTHLS